MKKAFLFLVVALVLALAGNGHSALINVPGDMDLQTALDTADSNGQNDTINIAAGTYNTSGSTFLYYPLPGVPEENYSLTVTGVSAGSTVLDGGGSDRVMVIYTGDLGVDSNAHVTVSGITFQNGTGSQNGAGLFVLTTLANVTVEDCEFSGNTAEDAHGGGAYVYSVGDPSGSGDMTLRNNVFRNNTSSAIFGFPRGGGAYGYSDSGALIFTNNIFNGNTGENDGGGAYGESQTGTVTFTNNTFSGNDAVNADGGGFLIILALNAAGNIYNNIAWNNTATGNGDDICVNHTGATVNLYNNDYNDFYMQVGGNLSQGNNINTDPLFVDDSDPDPSNWDLHITDTSPCIDAGTATAPSLPATDFDGEPRPSGSAPDIGADEVQSGLPLVDSDSGSGCFIATAAYGSHMANEVNVLKRVRDEYLLTNYLGKTVVSFYYKHSPQLADSISRHPFLKSIVRVGLYPLVQASRLVIETDGDRR